MSQDTTNSSPAAVDEIADPKPADLPTRIPSGKFKPISSVSATWR
jgi:hypothetical protein